MCVLLANLLIAYYVVWTAAGQSSTCDYGPFSETAALRLLADYFEDSYVCVAVIAWIVLRMDKV
jgi:hypothetical protein